MIHVPEDGAVENPGIVLRHLDVGVAQHLGHVLQTDAVGQADRGCIRVSGQVHK